MAKAKRDYIQNQVFVGLPWKNVRKRYDNVIPKLERKYPVHFTLVGRNDGQDAADLFEIIKQRIEASSYGVFDATGGNANVSLEYGYAEGLEVPRAIFLSAHKAANRNSAGSPIISDLTGKRRVQYKTEQTLLKELERLCREHDYTRRFEKALGNILKNKPKGDKKRRRGLALKAIRALDGKPKVRRAELMQHLQAEGYIESEVDEMLSRLNAEGVLKCTVGRFSEAYIT